MLFRYFGQQAAWERKGFRFKMPIKLLDSTLVSLTISVYDWAHYTTSKGAVKMHTLLDYDCLLPEFMNITGGSEQTTRRHLTLKSNRTALWWLTADIAIMDF